MSLIEVIQLVGYGTGAALHLWMVALLWGRRGALKRIERVLLVLAVAIGLWHASNLIIALRASLGLDPRSWESLLRFADALSVASVTFAYSLLLHAHLHLWADAQGRELKRSERARVYLSYIPALFLPLALMHIWRGDYAPMLTKLAQVSLPFSASVSFVLAFSLWAVYVLAFVAVTDWLIARASRSPSEKRLLSWLAASFVGIGALVLAALAFGIGAGSTLGLYLTTFANLGSLVPTALLAYHIYRYRYLELLIRESLVVATFAAAVLVFYVYGVRAIGGWLAGELALRPAAVEALLILMLALVAAPLRRWLEGRFHRLFEREAALYRDVVARIGAGARRYKQLPELLRFVAARTAEALGLRRVRFLIQKNERDHEASDNAGENGDAKRGEREAKEAPAPDSWRSWEHDVWRSLRERGWEALEDDSVLKEHGYRIAYALRREDQAVGMMLIDAPDDALTSEARAVLEVLAGQVAIAVEDSRLVEENVRLERRLAQGERLAALGQMAATVAHEVKNPLSAIKSIAQVMREDDAMRAEYARDLDLIVGETDRLSRSVTQLLSFARTAPPSDAACRADDLLRAIAELFRAEATARAINFTCVSATDVMLDGAHAAALRDALTNLVLNALQATPRGGSVSVAARLERGDLIISVADSGAGVPADLRARIWEPFFTTKQRGTGLGLAIARKRMEEVSGIVRLLPSSGGEGTRFELSLPVQTALRPT